MKYYCINFEECGYYEKTTEYIKDEDLICPICYGQVLRFTDNYKSREFEKFYFRNKKDS